MQPIDLLTCRFKKFCYICNSMQTIGGAIVEGYSNLVTGKNAELAQSRITICSGCEKFTKFGTCRLCHCVMRVKASIAQKKCPLGKW